MDITRLIAGLKLFGWQVIKQASRYVTLWLAGTAIFTIAAFSLDSNYAMTADDFARHAQLCMAFVVIFFLVKIAVMPFRADFVSNVPDGTE